MNILVELKGKMEQWYTSWSGFLVPVFRFLIAFLSFYSLNHTLGYLKPLTSLYMVLVLSLLAAILPWKGMVFLCMAVLVAHCMALHVLVGGLALLILLVLWILVLRFTPKEAMALVLTPIAFQLHIPALVPIGYGLAGTPVSAIGASCGVVVYYLCKMVPLNLAPMIQSDEKLEMVSLIQAFFDGLLKNEEMLLAVIACAVTVLLVHVIISSSADFAWQISIAAGALVYAVMMVGGGLLLGVSLSLPALIAGTAVSFVFGMLLQFFLFGADYKKSESLRFEDDEYYYYVKAIPKYVISRPGKSKDDEEELFEMDEEDTEETETADEVPPLDLDGNNPDDVDYESMLEDTLKNL